MTERATVLVVDDDADTRKLIKLRVESEGYKVITAENGSEAMSQVLNRRPDVVITDLRMPRMDGMELLEALGREAPTMPVILVTAHGSIPDAVEATKRGAFSFITKPIDKDELVEQLEKATRTWFADAEQAQSDAIITRSAEMNDLMARATRAAATGLSVLVTGESGTGKELLASFIHEKSARKGDFVPVNCSAIPENLFESELFGHEKGAFTGAERAQQGLIRAADGGTLFLDEIGDMPLAIQAKMLRVLQEQKVRPVGAQREVDVDVLVVSATHKDLGAMVKENAFREDLFYRINVVQLRVPSLRERPEDIPVLAQYFLSALIERTGDRRVFAPEAMELLVSCQWQGNIRQLQNVVQQTFAMATNEIITARLVVDALGDSEARLPSFDSARDEFTRNYLVQLLKITEGNVTQAARLAGRNRTDFHKILKKLDIDAAEFKNQDGE